MDKPLVMTTTTATGFEYYKALHAEFNEMCPVANQYVIELYARPRKFILETGPMLDRFIREQSMPGTPGSRGFPADHVMDFIGLVDDFTLETIALFNEHKSHVDDCKNYMEKTRKLDINFAHLDYAENDYRRLTLEVLELHNGLIKIKDRADEMIKRLNALEERWDNIKLKINN